MGDAAVAVQFEARIDAVINARVIRLAELVQSRRVAGVRDVVPTFRSVAVYFDPLRTRLDGLIEWLEEAARGVDASLRSSGTLIQVPVCYGGDFGPDLPGVARFAEMTPEDVVEAHAGTLYQVFMLGFVPGFAYLGSVDPRIAAPRHSTPRVRVPAGSVGIAGAQTGVYPMETPGGWQLIGRTPVKPFDLSRPEVCLFKAGDRVQFVPIVPSDFERMSRET